jgi:hypothetical protein
MNIFRIVSMLNIVCFLQNRLYLKTYRVQYLMLPFSILFSFITMFKVLLFDAIILLIAFIEITNFVNYCWNFKNRNCEKMCYNCESYSLCG